MFPHVWKEFAEKMQEDYDQGIQEPNNQIQAPQYDNVVFQVQWGVCQTQQKFQDQIHDVITNRHVPFVNSGKDKIFMIIEYPCYILRIQRRFITRKTRWFRAQHSHYSWGARQRKYHTSIQKVWIEDHVESLKCYFRLTDLAHNALIALG